MWSSVVEPPPSSAGPGSRRIGVWCGGLLGCNMTRTARPRRRATAQQGSPDMARSRPPIGCALAPPRRACFGSCYSVVATASSQGAQSTTTTEAKFGLEVHLVPIPGITCADAVLVCNEVQNLKSLVFDLKHNQHRAICSLLGVLVTLVK